MHAKYETYISYIGKVIAKVKVSFFQMVIFSINVMDVKVTRSLTLVSFERVSIVEYA